MQHVAFQSTKRRDSQEVEGRGKNHQNRKLNSNSVRKKLQKILNLLFLKNQNLPQNQQLRNLEKVKYFFIIFSHWLTDLQEKPARELRGYLAQANIDSSDCVEKDDFINKILKHGAYSRDTTPIPTPAPAPAPAPAAEAPKPSNPFRRETQNAAPTPTPAATQSPPSSPHIPNYSNPYPNTPAATPNTMPGGAYNTYPGSGASSPHANPPPVPPQQQQQESPPLHKGHFDDDVDYYKILGIGTS